MCPSRGLLPWLWKHHRWFVCSSTEKWDVRIVLTGSKWRGRSSSGAGAGLASIWSVSLWWQQSHTRPWGARHWKIRVDSLFYSNMWPLIENVRWCLKLFYIFYWGGIQSFNLTVSEFQLIETERWWILKDLKYQIFEGRKPREKAPML